jgi:hypothetical protein
MAIVTRLGELQNREAAECLVQFLNDDSFSFDGEAGLNLLYSISLCGEDALGPLAKVTGSRKILVKDLVTAIKAGELYGL